jgi:predicted transglutaminase-like cysteine proteinase
MKNVLIAPAIALAMLLPSGAFSDAHEALFVPISTLAPPPSAFQDSGVTETYNWSYVFSAEEVRATDVARSAVPFMPGPDLMRQIDRVNLSENSIEHDPSGRRRDCVAYVEAKAEALRQLGVPEEALSPAVVLTPGGIVHAVLILTTDAGDVVLDNLSSDIRPWGDLDYVWVERRFASDRGADWAWVGDLHTPTTRRYLAR